jgi:superfamily II DNA/RNA helicase
LKTDPVMSKNKVLIFTEFTTTARYLVEQLEMAGFTALDEVDGNNADRQGVIRKFSPYYNGASSGALAREGLEETRILISTDVLAEGLNLQDATRLINYDLHWNPVRLMQRIGRVDRRMSPEVEANILADHPEQKPIRGKIEYWNFLPPEELDELLRLYGRVAKKTLRISKTFGIEGKKLLVPEDDFEALKDFTHGYEGVTSPLEKLRLEHQKLLASNPELAGRLGSFPMRVFSGKKHPSANALAVFFCYSLPALKQPTQGEEPEWTAEGGEVKWYYYDLETGKIEDSPEKIAGYIRASKETPRSLTIPRSTLSESRGIVEKHIKDTYLKRVNPPAKIKPILIAWMELN